LLIFSQLFELISGCINYKFNDILDMAIPLSSILYQNSHIFAIIMNAPPSKAPIPTAPVGAPAVRAVEVPVPFAVDDAPLNATD